MADSRDNFSLFNQDDVQGLVTEHVAKGLVLTPYLEMRTTGADNYVWTVEDYTAQAAIDAGILDLPDVRAPGSELKMVRGTGVSPKAKPLMMTGFKYLCETDRIEKQPYTVERELRRFAYAIGKQVETDAITVLSAKAAAGTASVNDGTWASSSKIDEDVIEMQAEFFDDSLPDQLSISFYDATNFQELKKFIRAQEGAGAGFEDARSFDWLGTRHVYGGSGMSHGTSYGFDMANPPAVVAYGVEEGAFNPSVLNGMEGYAPIINVKIKDISDEIPRKTEIYMAAKYAVAVEEPNALQKQTGL
jgi:hypothetical protein